MIKKVLLVLCAFFAVLTLHAQKDNVFKGYLYNDEYQVYIEMDSIITRLRCQDKRFLETFRAILGQKEMCVSGSLPMQNSKIPRQLSSPSPTTMAAKTLKPH